jgi:hypothetical protein
MGKADEMVARKRHNKAVMDLPATFCNTVEFNLSELGLRFTFGELPLIDGEEATYRVAIFIPASMVAGMSQTLVKIQQDQAAKQQKAKDALQN